MMQNGILNDICDISFIRFFLYFKCYLDEIKVKPELRAKIE